MLVDSPRTSLIVFMVSAIAVAGGCDSKPRRSGAASLADTGPPMTGIASADQPANAFRFVGVEQSLTEARKALGEEKWDDAIAAARWLLTQDPPHPDAHKIIEKAEREIACSAAFEALKKAAAARDPATAVAQLRKIASDSVYLDRARRAFERFRDGWLWAREGEARQAAQRNRCREARRIAQLAADAFPESRGKIDAIADECRPPPPSADADSQARQAASAGDTPMVTMPEL